MRLKMLVSLKDETQNILSKYKDFLEVHEFEDGEELRNFLEGADAPECEKIQKRREMLLIAATDETIALGKKLSVATAAYLNPKISGQSLSGVEYLIEGFEEADVPFLEKVWQRFHHIPWIIAETPRCIIRELSLEDMDALFELYSDKELTRYTETLFNYDEETKYQRAYINNMYRFFGYGMWLVFLKESGELIGRAGLEHREIHGQTVLELGYLIGTKYQKQGYAKEACRAIIEFARENTGFDEINCVIQVENTASVHLAEKLGFTYEDELELAGKKMLRYVYR